MTTTPCPLCNAPLHLEPFATTGRCPGCGFNFGRMLSALTPDSSDQPSRDSLDTVEMVMEWEESLDVSISEAEAESLKSIQDIIDFMKKHRRRSPGEQGHG